MERAEIRVTAGVLAYVIFCAVIVCLVPYEAYTLPSKVCLRHDHQRTVETRMTLTIDGKTNVQNSREEHAWNTWEDTPAVYTVVRRSPRKSGDYQYVVKNQLGEEFECGFRKDLPERFRTTCFFVPRRCPPRYAIIDADTNKEYWNSWSS